MMDKSQISNCPHCGKSIRYRAVRVRCPYCDASMTFSLPEYEFHKGVVGCEHCHRKSDLRIGGYYRGWANSTLRTTEPVWDNGVPISGGRLLSIKPVVPVEMVLGVSKKIPAELRQDIDSAVKCFEIAEYKATAILCRRCVQSALKNRGIPEDSPSRMVNIARQRGVLSELAKKQSDAVTFMGNKAAHPQDDPLLDLSKSDVLQGLQMVRRILLELFDPDRLAVT